MVTRRIDDYGVAMSGQETQLTREEFIESAARLSRKISSELDRLDAGDLDVLDEIATNARMAIGRGSGNDVVKRLCKQNHAEPPSVLAAMAPDDNRQTIFSVGYVPSDPAEGHGIQAALSFLDWQNAPAVVSKGNIRRVTKWHEFITQFGNTFGAHISQTIPRTLTEAQLYGAPGGKLDAYLLRAAAVVAEHSITDVLTSLGYEGELRDDHRFSPNNATFGGISISEDGGGVGASMAFSLAKAEALRVARLPLADKMVTVSTVLDADGPRLEVRWEPLT